MSLMYLATLAAVCSDSEQGLFHKIVFEEQVPTTALFFKFCDSNVVALISGLPIEKIE